MYSPNYFADPLGSLLDVLSSTPTGTMHYPTKKYLSADVLLEMLKAVSIDTTLVLEKLGKISKGLEDGNT